MSIFKLFHSLSLSLSLTANRWCTRPPPVWRLCTWWGCGNIGVPLPARPGPGPCSGPPRRPTGPLCAGTRTTWSGRGRTRRGWSPGDAPCWRSRRGRGRSSWRAASGSTYATSPPAGQCPAPEPPSPRRCLRNGRSSRRMDVLPTVCSILKHNVYIYEWNIERGDAEDS